MSDLLNTLLSLLSPLGLLWLVLLEETCRHLWRRRWRPALLWLGPTLLLTLFSCTALPSMLVYSLERQWPAVDPSTLPVCDAIVCLGGSSEPSLHEPAGFHLQMAADRLSAALTVAKAGKASHLVLGGGGYDDGQTWHSEADAVKHWLDAETLCPLPVISLGLCANTHDESLKVAQLCHQYGWKQVILITSASHLNRAVATFRKSGVQVVPCPCNYTSGKMRIETVHWLHLPNSAGFDSFEIWSHEIIGWVVYRWRGWL